MLAELKERIAEEAMHAQIRALQAIEARRCNFEKVLAELKEWIAYTEAVHAQTRALQAVEAMFCNYDRVLAELSQRVDHRSRACSNTSPM